MSDRNVSALNTTDENFVIVRCKMCHKILTEVSENATGKIRQKCLKCKVMNKISLPLRVKTTTILAGRNAQTV